MEFYNDKIKEIRKLQKTNLTELAEIMNSNRNTIWLWESGRTKPNEKMVRLPAKTLDISVSEISSLQDAIPVSLFADSKSLTAKLSSASEMNINKEKNLQSYFMNKLKGHFDELNSIVSLVSTVLNSSPIICYAKDIQNKYIIVNKVFLRNAGVSEEYSTLGAITIFGYVLGS